MTHGREFIENEARLARARGQGRFIPETRVQAEQAKAGREALDADWPCEVKTSDDLVGVHPYWRAAYRMRYHQRMGWDGDRPHRAVIDGDRCGKCGSYPEDPIHAGQH